MRRMVRNLENGFYVGVILYKRRHSLGSIVQIRFLPRRNETQMALFEVYVISHWDSAQNPNPRFLLNRPFHMIQMRLSPDSILYHSLYPYLSVKELEPQDGRGDGG